MPSPQTEHHSKWRLQYKPCWREPCSVLTHGKQVCVTTIPHRAVCNKLSTMQHCVRVQRHLHHTPNVTPYPHTWRGRGQWHRLEGRRNASADGWKAFTASTAGKNVWSMLHIADHTLSVSDGGRHSQISRPCWTLLWQCTKVGKLVAQLV